MTSKQTCRAHPRRAPFHNYTMDSNQSSFGLCSSCLSYFVMVARGIMAMIFCLCVMAVL